MAETKDRSPFSLLRSLFFKRPAPPKAGAPPTSAPVEVPATVALEVPRLPTPRKRAHFHELYEVTKDLGNGSYSLVKQVTHKRHGGCFAAKIIDKSALSKVDRHALSQEVDVLKKLNHDYVMQLHEVFDDDATCYMVVEYLDGGDLFDRVTKRGKLLETEAQFIMAALLEAVDYCHSRCVIHRDIKPENIMLSGHMIKLCDFGFARQLIAVDERASDSCGTPGYAAPEVLNGHPYGCEVDIFSLGVVFYILLCGYPPFPMKLHKLRKHTFEVVFPPKEWQCVSDEIKSLIRSMLSVIPSHRPSALALRMHPWMKAGREKLPPRPISDLRSDLYGPRGVHAIKYGRHGFPHATHVRICDVCHTLTWSSKSIRDPMTPSSSVARSFFGTTSPRPSSSRPGGRCAHTQMGLLLESVVRVVHGPRTPVFDRVMRPTPDNCCSLLTKTRTLDLEFGSKRVCEEMLELFTNAIVDAAAATPPETTRRALVAPTLSP
ncbi:CAMK/CAMK1 protein kinase [Saprolegnia diclina VS20]|uniref:CAMK/CAMK1 protein kinase n=1 Tax=Saprolegnia diclina (strain VS20) TaxID=1156394 RepID=T0QK34_SAPDV|nr:CAMK/CAMK1 protein kinase [Saprolegnia diclina VS20]EQC38379.1 CAMK/CAMK1 protein kinase [Saprolegnia diclina VS20]|eukprot:XP_008607971.1 CAMK/CAMK1 protein kinase [Saprolegnia diclina VS20]